MAKITLKDKYGRVLAVTGEDDPVAETGETATIDSKPAKRVVDTVTSETGYVEEEVLETWTESTVQIPANFVGLETVMVPTRLRDQLFDITKVDEQEGYVEITAVHIFYRMRQNTTTWVPGATTKYSGASACRNVLTNAMFEPGFNVASDSTDQIDGNRLDYENKNIVEAFLDPESGICAKWDLSLIRDNDVFYCLKSVGYDRGMVIQNRKNMIGVERTEDSEETITRVAPVARDANGDLVWLNYNSKKYIDSTHISEYPAPKLEIYHTDLRIGENGVTAENVQAKLLEAAQKRFSDDEVDVPDITMQIQFVSLGDTEEYAQYRGLDKVYLFDIIHVKDTDRGYSYSAQVVGVQHNILTGVLESVTIGKLKKWDGIRKIGSWQVPEFNGGNIRPGSIRAGSFEAAAVHQGDIADGAITSSHMSQSADGHFKALFAEELYISNTSEDGLLNTRFSVSEGQIEGLITKTGVNSLGQNETLYSRLTQTAEAITAEVTRATTAEGTISGSLTVEAGKISQIVTAVGANGQVTAASIVTAINQTTGQGEVHIDADHVYINAGQSGERNVVTEIGGKLVANDITANFLEDRIAQIGTLRGIAASFSGNVSASGILGGQVYVGGGTSFVNISNPVMDISESSGVVTVTWANGDTENFNAAASVVEDSRTSWTSGLVTITLTNGNTINVSIPAVSATDWVNPSADNWKAKVTIGGADRYSDEKDFSSLRTAGYNSAHLSGSWGSGNDSNKFTVTKVNTGSSDSLSCVVTAGISYNSSTHKYTATAYGNQASKATAASGTEAYEAGYGSAHLSGSWGSGNSANTFTVTKVQSGSSNSLTCTVTAGITYNSNTHKYTATAYGNQASKATAASGTEAYDAGYKKGYNDALSDAGVADGGTVYTGTVYQGTVWTAPQQGSSTYNYPVVLWTGHTLTKK